MLKLLRKVRRRFRSLWQNPWARPAVIVLIRYSVFLRSQASNVWVVSRDGTADDYRDKLFDDARLQFRLATLTRIVLPSLAAQSVKMSPSRHRVLIFTSTELPAAHMAALRSAVADLPWVSIELVAPESESIDFAAATGRAIGEMGYRGVYATVRLDDDDALARSFFRKLGGHVVSQNVGKVVTFPKGVVGRLEERESLQFKGFFERTHRYIGAGLALIAATTHEPRTVFDVGPHNRARAHPHLIDWSFRAWLRSWHPGMDSGGTYADSSWLRHPIAEALVREEFTTLA